MHCDEVLNTLFSSLYRFGFVLIECYPSEDRKSETYFITLEQISSFTRFKFYTRDFQIIQSCSLFETDTIRKQTLNTIDANNLKIKSFGYVFNDQELDMIIQVFSNTNHLAYTFTSMHLVIDKHEVSLRYDLEDKADLDEFLEDYNAVIELIKKEGKKIQLVQPTAQVLVRKIKLKSFGFE